MKFRSICRYFCFGRRNYSLSDWFGHISFVLYIHGQEKNKNWAFQVTFIRTKICGSLPLVDQMIFFYSCCRMIFPRPWTICMCGVSPSTVTVLSQIMFKLRSPESTNFPNSTQNGQMRIAMSVDVLADLKPKCQIYWYIKKCKHKIKPFLLTFIFTFCSKIIKN